MRKRQPAAFNLTRDMLRDARMIERAFGAGDCALADATAFINPPLATQTT